MSDTNQMRELGGLMDNLYLQSKNRIGEPAPPTPQRQKKKVAAARAAESSRGGARGGTENEPLSKSSTSVVPASPSRSRAKVREATERIARAHPSDHLPEVPRSRAQAEHHRQRSEIQQLLPRASHAPIEKKRFNTTLSKPTGGNSLTGKRWNLSCFTMGKPIGKGRFGNVYLAREKASMKVLALKIMLKKDLEAAGVYHQVKSEIDIHVNYGSGCPNIVRCYGYFYDEKRIFIVMEYARKGELYRTMKSQPGGRFTEDVASRYIFQLVRALQYLHGLNVIHRDIKPENLLLDKSGNLRLCDFGWSIEVADYDMRQTICGTQDYLAPEMLMERPYTTSVDLWAAGVVTYEFLLGRSPFRSESGGADTLSRIQRGLYDFPEQPTLSAEAKDFMSKLLQVEPADRMTLAEAIEHPWLRSQAIAAAASERTPTASMRASNGDSQGR